MTAVDYLRMGFDLQDSNMLWLGRQKPTSALQLWCSHQLAEHVSNEEYRAVCYAETGFRERLSLLAVFRDGCRVAVNLCRSLSHPDFDGKDISALTQKARLTCSAVRRHMQVARQERATAKLSRHTMAALSGRERQVITHVLEGMTMPEVARQLPTAKSRLSPRRCSKAK